MNNRNLDGALVKMRESIASFCSTYNPSTNATVTAMCERIGMDIGQGSGILTKLGEAKEIYREGKITYLLRLDDYQIETIAVENYELLEKLAAVGCVEADFLVRSFTDKETAAENIPQLQRLANLGFKPALKMLETISNDVEINSNVSSFLMHFFLFSNLNLSQESLNLSQPQFENNSNLNEIDSNALKEKNVLKSFFPNVSQNLEEVVGENPSRKFSSGSEAKRSAEEDSDESQTNNTRSENPKTEVPPSGEGKNGVKTEVPLGGEGKRGKSRRAAKSKDKPARDNSDQKQTRPDIEDDADWLAWLNEQPENRKINVTGKYSEMIDWCRKNRKTPSRLRLVNWLAKERKSLPMEARIESETPEIIAEIQIDSPVDELSPAELEEAYESLRNKTDFFYFEDQFTPNDWRWLMEKMDKKASVETVGQQRMTVWK